MYVYVASSWRNLFQPAVVQMLRDEGHDAYDFKEQATGFHWSAIDPDWRHWDAGTYLAALDTEEANKGYMKDVGALLKCDLCVMVMPCGLSAGLELGYAAGLGKATIVYVPELREAELMVKVADSFCRTAEMLRELVNGVAAALLQTQALAAVGFVA